MIEHDSNPTPNSHKTESKVGERAVSGALRKSRDILRESKQKGEPYSNRLAVVTTPETSRNTDKSKD